MAKKDNKKTKGKRGGGAKVPMFMVVLLLMSVVFLSTSIILFIGLIPAFVAFFVDQSKNKSKAVTVGSFNVMGCIPFVVELWSHESTMDRALSIILDPVALIVIYAVAGLGYIVDWGVSSLVSGILYKQGLSRRKSIKKRQQALIERWGKGVSGGVADAPMPVQKKVE